MADTLYLPIAIFGYKYLFVVVDLATNKFDVETIKNKESETAKHIFTGPIELSNASLKAW